MGKTTAAIAVVAAVLALSWLTEAGTANAARGNTAARPAVVNHVPVRPGSTWTFRLNGGACEVDHFGVHRFTTAGRFSDAGTYTANDPHLAMKWTRGPDFSTIFTGTFSVTTGTYSGTWFDGDRIPATLAPGVHCA
jgi:hypothetical protein